MTTQANVALHIEDKATERANVELEAAKARAAASDKIVGSLRFATWILAGATVV